MKYLTNWARRNLLQTLALIFFVIAVFLFQSTNTTLKAIATVLVIVAFIFLQLDNSTTIPSLLFVGLIVTFFALCSSWWNNEQVFGRIISDSAMIVIVTTIYVILTYLNIQSNKQIFDTARLPYLQIEFGLGQHILTIHNIDKKYRAEKVEVLIEFEKAPKKGFGGLIASKLKHTFRKYLENEIKFEISEIMPESRVPIRLESFFAKKFLKRVSKNNPYKGVDMFATKNKQKFRVNIRIKYSTDTGFESPQDVKRTFYFERNQNGLELKKETPNVKRVY